MSTRVWKRGKEQGRKVVRDVKEGGRQRNRDNVRCRRVALWNNLGHQTSRHPKHFQLFNLLSISDLHSNK